MRKWLLLVLALLGVQLALAIKPFRGPCPQNMTAMGDFNMRRFLGKWYIHSKYPNLPKRKLRECQSVTYKYDENDKKYTVETRKLSRQTATVKFAKADILKVQSKAGRYVQDTKNAVFPEGIQIYVVDTDYHNYAIRYMCFDSSKIYSFHWAVLQFRKRLPSADLVEKAQKIARANGIIIGILVKIPQDSCPPDT